MISPVVTVLRKWISREKNPASESISYQRGPSADDRCPQVLSLPWLENSSLCAWRLSCTRPPVNSIKPLPTQAGSLRFHSALFPRVLAVLVIRARYAARSLGG